MHQIILTILACFQLMKGIHMSKLLQPLARAAITFFLISTPITLLADTQPTQPATTIQQKLAALEASADGRIGIAAIDTANNTAIQYRADERFPLCSTSKLMGVAAVLKQSMKDNDLLNQKVTYTEKDIVSYSPITEKNLAKGMTVSELCMATMTYSDNSAMNLLLKKIGGAGAVNTFARSVGDNKFRLDRPEPELNSAIPGDPRDTSTPAAMQKSLQQLGLGNVLAAAQQKQLQTWLKENTTGNSRIRAAVPKNWVVGDKTGTGEYGTTNDVGIIWPKNCPPIVVAIYFTQNKKEAKPKDDVIASATQLILKEFANTNKCIKLG